MIPALYALAILVGVFLAGCLVAVWLKASANRHPLAQDWTPPRGLVRVIGREQDEAP